MQVAFERHPGFRRSRVVVGAIGAIITHVIEVWIFTGGCLLVLRFDPDSSLLHLDNGGWDHLHDVIYYSFVCYTSLGFGDIIPEGPIRFFTAFETLTGLVMIAWTASFMFLQMQRSWIDTTPRV